MADNMTLKVGENTPEYVALLLTKMVADVERRKLGHSLGAGDIADRAYILDTYAECLTAVRGHR